MPSARQTYEDDVVLSFVIEDRAVLACYGWQDLDPGHGFHRNERGQTRYTVSPDARREILRRLLDLNLEIAAAERQSELARSAGRRPKIAS